VAAFFVVSPDVFSVVELCATSSPGARRRKLPSPSKAGFRTRRDSKAGISFVHISDGSAFHPVQAVVPNTLSNFADVQKLTAGCAVEATGTIVPSPAKGQPFEMQASEVRVVGWVEDPDHYPIQPKPHTMEFLREVAHLRPRTNVIGAATRVRHTVAKAIHRFFDENGFVWVATPIITSADAEGAGAMFRVSTLDKEHFFGREAFLTVSGQLNVEAYCLAMSKVYTFGPTFRAENSNTSRHSCRVLDDRARDRLRRAQGRRRPGRGPAEVRLPGAARGATGGRGVFSRNESRKA
jgi:asparaginyl-tRNA synthetase